MSTQKKRKKEQKEKEKENKQANNNNNNKRKQKEKQRSAGGRKGRRTRAAAKAVLIAAGSSQSRLYDGVASDAYILACSPGPDSARHQWQPWFGSHPSLGSAQLWLPQVCDCHQQLDFNFSQNKADYPCLPITASLSPCLSLSVHLSVLCIFPTVWLRPAWLALP